MCGHRWGLHITATTAIYKETQKSVRVCVLFLQYDIQHILNKVSANQTKRVLGLLTPLAVRIGLAFSLGTKARR